MNSFHSNVNKRPHRQLYAILSSASRIRGGAVKPTTSPVNVSGDLVPRSELLFSGTEMALDRLHSSKTRVAVDTTKLEDEKLAMAVLIS
jgi:hypothetical protein